MNEQNTEGGRSAGVKAIDGGQAPKPMQGLADWLRMVAETQAGSAKDEAAMLQWAREVEAVLPRNPIPVEQLRAMRSEARASDECEREHWFILFARAIERAHGVALAARPAYTWPSKACPCNSNQKPDCQEHGCEWTRDPSKVPEALRVPRGVAIPDGGKS